jgi:hypothetical protein
MPRYGDAFDHFKITIQKYLQVTPAGSRSKDSKDVIQPVLNARRQNST